jgi:hypothetical protein
VRRVSKAVKCIGAEGLSRARLAREGRTRQVGPAERVGGGGEAQQQRPQARQLRGCHVRRQRSRLRSECEGLLAPRCAVGRVVAGCATLRSRQLRHATLRRTRAPSAAAAVGGEDGCEGSTKPPAPLSRAVACAAASSSAWRAAPPAAARALRLPLLPVDGGPVGGATTAGSACVSAARGGRGAPPAGGPALRAFSIA